MLRLLFITLCTCALYLFLGTCMCGARIPPPPREETFLLDYAGVVRSSDRSSIESIQKDDYAIYDSPIYVITVKSLSDYDGNGKGIEKVAQAWFSSWKIGKESPDGSKFIDRGMLLLVSVVDQQVFVFPGGEWGDAWREHAQMLTQCEIIPSFKKNDYSGGILNGVKALDSMVKATPGGSPPGFYIWKHIYITYIIDGKYSAFSSPVRWIVVIIGVALIILSAFVPWGVFWFLVAGIGLVGIAFFTYPTIIIVVGVLSLFSPGRYGGRGCCDVFDNITCRSSREAGW